MRSQDRKLQKGGAVKDYVVTMLVRVDENTLKEEYGDNVEDMVRWSIPDETDFGFQVLGSEEVLSEKERMDDMDDIY